VSLLGKSLLVLAIPAVALPVATLLVWSHVRGRRPVRAAARLSLADVWVVSVHKMDVGFGPGSVFHAKATWSTHPTSQPVRTCS
jgi:hypothetical protein